MTSSKRGAPALDGARAVVMGLGRFGGGVGAAQYLLRSGAHVIGTDLRRAEELPEAVAALGGTAIEWRLGEHRESDFERADLVVANPAVRPDNTLLAAARRAGARVTSEVELFMAATSARLIGVTGTQGKSSTTTFITQLLASCGRSASAGGNLGGSLLDRVELLTSDDWVVLELSSYQLEALSHPPAQWQPFEAVAVTNIELDHLERHGDLAGYAAAKRRILELCGDASTAWLPSGPGPCATWSAPRGCIERFDPSLGEADLLLRDGWRAPGPVRLQLPAFQAGNLRLAFELVHTLGLSTAEIEAASSALAPPAHRLERLADLNGAAVYDNGVSTTPDSTAAALASLSVPVVLLAGGKLKALPTQALVAGARGRTRHVVTFGEAADVLAELFQADGTTATASGRLEDAVELAARLVRPGEALLFSPACASFDAFPNFKERAGAFRSALEAARSKADGRQGALS